MPTINVKRVLSNPRFNMSFTVWRKSGLFVKGKWFDQESSIPFRGVIINASPKEVEMFPEGDRIINAINVYTKNEIYTSHGPDAQNKKGISDEIEWNGKRYKVMTVNNYSDYGYYKTIAVYTGGD